MKHFNIINLKDMNKHNRNILPKFKRKDKSINSRFSNCQDAINKHIKNGFKHSKSIRNQNIHMLNYIIQFDDYGENIEMITKNIPNKRRCFHHRDRTSVYSFI